MNEKLCKELRRRARKLTKGMSQAKYIEDRLSKTMLLAPDCTRRVYKELKKRARAAR